ncbi:head decoration protein [Nitrospirillum sp. BR 11163]|uniref:head decoration protein n=1 Tax=Nitrospirillum sp. BR 11163 TaxID=3104323 RepID=UPI002AFE58AD|nr:head decoration protein [Nitrospirillum sp. BR 11163]MEA1674093.1 hypothetical protein [Nitrospirillum sp. BR 11163]
MSSAPSYSRTSWSPDQLLAGDIQRKTKTVTLVAGTAYTRGMVLGAVMFGTATSAANGGMVGNGTLTLDATTPVLANAQQGAYVARCIAAAANGGTFRVFDPTGDVLGDVAVGATFADQVKFVIADGATDFAVNDTFTITVPTATEKYKLSAKAATDGSQVPNCVLAEDADATGGDTLAPVYLTGDFNAAAVTLGAGHTVASVSAGLRTQGIFLTGTIPA